MPKLRTKDIQKVIQVFDNELLMIQRISKIEKMKMRKKVVNVVQPILTSATSTPEVFMLEAETKLADIIARFIDKYGFHNRLAETVRKLYEKAEESSALPSPAESGKDTGQPKAG
jgi:hypothetical protein